MDTDEFRQWMASTDADEERYGPTDAFGCCLGPDRCLMPGFHHPSECYTVEDAEAMVYEQTFQSEVGTWADETFDSTIFAILLHLAEESVELVGIDIMEKALANLRARTPVVQDFDFAANAREESADVYMLLLHLAHREGFDLEAVAREKLAKNRQRVWGPRDEDGVSRHVAEGATR